MKKEKESWTLLWVWTTYLQAKEIKWEFYVKASDFNRCMDGIRIEQEADRKHIEELEEKNKKLKSDLAFERTMLDNVKAEYKSLQNVNKKLNEKIEKMEYWNSLAFDDIERICNEKLELKEENKTLKEKVRFLEECLDRKEKLNEGYRKEIEKLKSTHVYDAKQVRDIC